MPVININEVALNYRELGNRRNRTMVFTHTVLWDAEMLDHLVSEFANDFHLIIVDLHGHGQSGYRTPLTLEEMAEDYHQLLAKLGLSNCCDQSANTGDCRKRGSGDLAGGIRTDCFSYPERAISDY